MEAEQTVGILTNHVARQYAILLADKLKPLGLAPAQFPILLHLWENDGLSQNEIVVRTDLRQATIANTLMRMERDGLVRRADHPTDKRIRTIKLTEKARALEAEAKKIALEINRETLQVLTVDEQQQFLEMTKKLIKQQKVLLADKDAYEIQDVKEFDPADEFFS